MPQFAQIIQRLHGSAWAIHPDKLALICQFLETRLSGSVVPPESVAAAVAERDSRTPIRNVRGDVAVIPVFGTLVHHASHLEKLSGAVAPEDVAESFDKAMNNKDVKAIVLHIDSPGGVAYGIPELAAKLHAARGNKRVIAVADGMAASAAYWIATGADEFVASPSAHVGSIGVYQVHVDVSKWEEKKGFKTSLVSAGKYKVEGNPFEPLADEAKASWQENVDELHAQFIDAVAKYRGVTSAKVRSEFGEGRTLRAAKAVERGMVDRVETVESVVNKLTGGQRRRVVKADLLRRKLNLKAT